MLTRAIPRIIFKHLPATRLSFLLAALITIGVAASAWAILKPASKRETGASMSKAAPSALALTQNNAEKDRVETEIITLRPTGFDPVEIARPKGRVLLAINNNAGLDEVSLRLKREHGGVLHEERINRRKQNLRKVINFAPGSYTLTEASHPGWVCRITITD